MITVDVLRALLVASIPVAYLLDGLGMTQLYVVAFLIGTASTFFEVANSTLFVSVVKPDQYVPANSLLNGARAMSFAAGPSLGGALVQWLTAPVALLFDAVSFLFSAVLAGPGPVDEPEPETSREGQLTAGLRFLTGNRSMWTLLASVATVNLFNYMFAALAVLYFTVHLGVSPGVLGLGWGRLGRRPARLGGHRAAGARDRDRPAYRSGCWPPGAADPGTLAGGPRPAVLGLLFLAEFGAGLGVMILDIAAGSLLASLVPHRLRARVSGAFRTVNYGIRPVGALIGGASVRRSVSADAVATRPSARCWGVFWLVGSPLVRLRTLRSRRRELLLRRQRGRGGPATVGGRRFVRCGRWWTG
jgi:hypothetical protein